MGRGTSGRTSGRSIRRCFERHNRSGPKFLCPTKGIPQIRTYLLAPPTQAATINTPQPSPPKARSSAAAAGTTSTSAAAATTRGTIAPASRPAAVASWRRSAATAAARGSAHRHVSVKQLRQACRCPCLLPSQHYQQRLVTLSHKDPATTTISICHLQPTYARRHQRTRAQTWASNFRYKRSAHGS